MGKYGEERFVKAFGRFILYASSHSTVNVYNLFNLYMTTRGSLLTGIK
ncbi:hypothetical protein SAMN05216412_10648 [Nitrosospira multiformis]|uniref:Uncharacterized protein n=1 Tax=Nitrosospira multiformis TaxID=1231 RepID=A0A1I0E9J3_9PROT|nr:hypothetical protein SAMN05216412_10648 [Nitrosospira multiformis]